MSRLLWAAGVPSATPGHWCRRDIAIALVLDTSSATGAPASTAKLPPDQAVWAYSDAACRWGLGAAESSPILIPPERRGTMNLKRTAPTVGKRLVVTAVTAGLLFATSPTAAIASSSSDLQAQLQQAEAQTAKYQEQATNAFAELEQLQAQLEDTRAQIRLHAGGGLAEADRARRRARNPRRPRLLQLQDRRRLTHLDPLRLLELRGPRQPHLLCEPRGGV